MQVYLRRCCRKAASENLTGGQEAVGQVRACLQHPSATPHEYGFNKISTCCTCSAKSWFLPTNPAAYCDNYKDLCHELPCFCTNERHIM